MDIKDLEVRAIVSAGSINCSRLHPEKFYTLKNPGLVDFGYGTIIMEADVYSNDKLLGRVALNNFAFGLNANSLFKVGNAMNCMSIFVIKGDPLFPNMVFLYNNSISTTTMEFNGQQYILDHMHAFTVKEGTEILLVENNRPTVFGFFDDDEPMYLYDNE